jgi:hypothetical protein
VDFGVYMDLPLGCGVYVKWWVACPSPEEGGIWRSTNYVYYGSGGDMRWTRRASDAGFRLVYAADAEVLYPARSMGPLLRKQIRVGRGVPGVWASFGMSRMQMAGMIARGMLPMPPRRLAARVRERTTGTVPYDLARLWLAAWMCKAARSVGCIGGMLSPPPRED